jgi:hypothetical protein
MSFTVTQLLAEDEFKVVGTDVNGTYGEVKLVSPAWAEVIAREAHKAAAEVFDEYATEFLKPLIEGIEAAERIAHPSTNQWSEYVIDEGIEGVPAFRVKLDTAGQYLRMLAETDGSKLTWLNGELVAER